MENRDKTIQSFAQISSSPVARWNFKSTGKLIVDGKDTDALVGKIDYNNAMYEIGLAVKIGNWHFCLERMTERFRQMLNPEANPNNWIIGAFYGQCHYTFAEITASPKDLNDVLIKWVIDTCWIFVEPENNGKKHTWQIV